MVVLCVQVILVFRLIFVLKNIFHSPVRPLEQAQLNQVIKYGAEDLFREELEEDQAEPNPTNANGDVEKVTQRFILALYYYCYYYYTTILLRLLVLYCDC